VKIAIIGKGHVGRTIAKGLIGKYEVKFGHRDSKEPVVETAKWGEVIILAVSNGAIADAVKEIGSAADGKTLLDVTNAPTENGELAVGFTTSVAEELQKRMPKAYVAKAFNTIFAVNQSTGKVSNQQLTFFLWSEITQKQSKP
jgi:predicted dinucleotide-binding enzyme